MSMRVLREAFTAGLAGKGQLVSARLSYERDDVTRRDMQKIAFDVRYPDGTVHEITQVLEGTADLKTAARELGAATARDME